ncbi:hypothetical protein [Arenimonas sp.]|jgi:hypothetical protein|uniref:hypothetical protein n=1 Tax=Arenimonas sp. TaxID=1872635 RepID=UPI0037BE37A4
MDLQTVVGFYIDSHDGLSTKQVVDKVQKLSNHLISIHELYQWGIKDLPKQSTEDLSDQEDDEFWITDVNKSKEAFDDFIKYIETNGFDDEDGCCIVTDSSNRYKSQEIDIEEGNIEFVRSFEIDENRFCIYINIEVLYASEIEKIPSAGLDIFCDMNDVDNDYFEFRV